MRIKLLNFEVELDRQEKRLDLSWGGPELDWYGWAFIWGEEDKTWVYDGVTYYNRRWGLERFWYDGPHAQLSLYYWKVVWETPWTVPPPEYLEEKEQEKWRRRPAWVRKLLCMEFYESEVK